MVGSKKGSMRRELMKNGSCAELPGRIIKELPRGAVYMDQALYDASGLSGEK